MTYSKKRFWLALGSALAVAAIVPPLLHPYPIAMTVGVVTACAVLGFMAYFSLDEIQRQNEMRAWYHGGVLAILLGFAPLALLMSNSMLEAMARFIPDPSGMVPSKVHTPKVYFGLGAAAVLGMQLIGHLMAHAIFKVSGRARG